MKACSHATRTPDSRPASDFRGRMWAGWSSLVKAPGLGTPTTGPCINLPQFNWEFVRLAD
jgi:hypothetical protein